METVIIAHSGCGEAPNSTAFIQRASKSSAHVIEVDVNYTKDGHLILYHDQTITIDNHIHKVPDLNLCELKQVKPEVLLLTQAFKLLQDSDKIINLDIKSTEGIPTLIQMLKDENLIGKIIITGCDEHRVKLIRSLDESISIILSPDETSYIDVEAEDLLKVCRFALEIGCSSINIDYKYVTKEFVLYAKQRGISVFVWTLTNKLDVLRMVEMGVQSITVNSFDLIDQLNQLNYEGQKWIKAKVTNEEALHDSK